MKASPYAGVATKTPLHRGALAALIVGVIALLGLVGWQTWLAHDRGTALAHTRHTLTEVRGDLTATHTALDQSNKQITSLNGQLTRAQGDLGDAQAQLQGAQNTVGLQGREIGNLRTCLDGVSTSLTDLADGYTYSALSDLESVTSSCQAATSGLSS